MRTRTNRSGGVQGGITNGETIYFRVAFKPTATIMREQNTVSVPHEDTTITGRGRHDPCVLPRAPSRWWKRWPRSCWPTTRSATRLSCLRRSSERRCRGVSDPAV